MISQILTNQARQVIDPETHKEARTGALKLFGLAGFGILASIAAAYYLSVFFETGAFAMLFASFIAAALLIVASIFHVLFIRNGWALVGLVIIECLIIPLIFAPAGVFRDPSLVLIGASLLFGLFAFIGMRQSARMLANGVAFRFFSVAKPVAAKFATGFLIFLAVFGYLQYFEWNRLNAGMGQFFTNQILRTAEPILALQYAGVSFAQTMQEFTLAIAESTIQKTRYNPIDDSNLGLRGDLTQLPAATQGRIAEALSQNIHAALEGRFGRIGENERVGDVVFRIIGEWFGKFDDKTKQLVGVTGAVLAFFALRGIALLLLPFVEFLGFLLFKLMLATGLARVVTERRDCETILLT